MQNTTHLSQLEHYQKQGTRTTGAFYIGKVFHQRVAPKHHEFTYPLYMTYLDLDSVTTLAQQHWWLSWQGLAPLQFKVTDYLRDYRKTRTEPLKGTSPEALKALVLAAAEDLGADLEGIDRVAFLGNLRCFGLYFSPVNFFFLYRQATPCYMVAEVSNTPWNERHLYLVDLVTPLPHGKSFHVSPFMHMDMQYRWQIQAPQQRVLVTIECWQQSRLFVASFAGKHYPFTRKNIKKVLYQWPMVTLSILKGIYWQAAKLFAKRIPYVPKK